MTAGIFASRAKHEIMRDWLDLVLGYYGVLPDVFGTLDLMPLPAFRDDVSYTSGPRLMTYATLRNLNKWGNNDAIFKMTLINQDVTHHSFIWGKYYGFVVDDNPKKEAIAIGGTKYHFDQFGYQINVGSWHVPSDAEFLLPDGTYQS